MINDLTLLALGKGRASSIFVLDAFQQSEERIAHHCHESQHNQGIENIHRNPLFHLARSIDTRNDACIADKVGRIHLDGGAT